MLQKRGRERAMGVQRQSRCFLRENQWRFCGRSGIWTELRMKKQWGRIWVPCIAGRFSTVWATRKHSGAQMGEGWRDGMERWVKSGHEAGEADFQRFNSRLCPFCSACMIHANLTPSIEHAYCVPGPILGLCGRPRWFSFKISLQKLGKGL